MQSPKEKELAVIDALLDFAAEQLKGNPKLIKGCPMKVKEVEAAVLDIPPEDVKKILLSFRRKEIICHKDFSPEMFILYTKNLKDRRDSLLGKKSNKKESDVSSELLKKLENAKNWESIRIEFFDDIDYVDIFIGDEKVGKYHFDQLGFQMRSSKEARAVQCWGRMLLLMALREGEIEYDKESVVFKKDLQMRIKRLFPMLIGDPIEYRKEDKLYSSRIKLIFKGDIKERFLEKLSQKRGSRRSVEV